MNNVKIAVLLGITITIILMILLIDPTQTGLFALNEEPKIKIGLLMPLTGDAASWGQEEKEGAEIAIEEIKQKYPNNRIEFIIEDDKCDPKEGINSFEKIVNIDNATLTGGTICSSVVLAIANEANQNNIIHLSAGASNPKITTYGDYVMSLWPLDDSDGKAIAEYAINKLNKKKFAVIYINNDYGYGLMKYFSETIVKNNGEVKLIESFTPETKDFRAQLQKIKQTKVDAVYIASNPSEMALLLKQVKELDFNIQLLANGAAMESSEIKEDNTGITENIIYSMPKREISKEYTEKYEKKYKKESGFISNLGYDTVMILFNAANKCQEDSKCAKEYIQNLQNYSGAAQTLSFIEGKVIIPFEIKTIQNNKSITIQ
jgi:branched-chain amino acid transport system substrate-binding protein